LDWAGNLYTQPFGAPEPTAGDYDIRPDSQIDVTVVRPIDPNDKIGPVGAVSPRDTLYYIVNFENLATATAPVQELVVVDYVNPNLDWTTFQFSDIAYGGRLLSVPEGTTGFSRRDFPASSIITGTTDGPMAVDVTAFLNPHIGRIEWRFRAIDTGTGLPPEDPLAGFLLPEDGTGRGQGYVSFSIQPRSDVASGTRITNTASIVFDTNEPIETNEVWNIVDHRIFLPLVLRDL
jgi:hypothetical protein